MGALVPRQEQAPARVAVQPVNGAGQAAKPESEALQVIFERQGPVARTVDGQPGGLVDHQCLAVEEQDAVGMHVRALATAGRLLATALLLAASPATAQLCDGSSAPQSADGRMLGHLPYGDVPDAELAYAPPGFGLNGCRVRREMLPDLQRLLAAADAELGPRALRGLSCHRSLQTQASVFCKERAHPDARAISVAPPGHSEHTTGFAIDFAVRPSRGCPDAEACMAATRQARWLRENATRFGFEQSFPAANGQGVKWEPWHWRWVGADARAPGAERARRLFARARRDFPAEPGLVDPPPVVRTLPDPPAPVAVEKKRKRRAR